MTSWKLYHIEDGIFIIDDLASSLNSFCWGRSYMKLPGNYNHCDNIREPLCASVSLIGKSEQLTWMLSQTSCSLTHRYHPKAGVLYRWSSALLSQKSPWHICSCVVFMLPRSVEPQGAISRNEEAEPESLAGVRIDTSITIIGSQKPDFWKRSSVSKSVGEKVQGIPRKPVFFDLSDPLKSVLFV